MNAEDLKPNKVLRGPIFSEPVQILVSTPLGDAIKVIGRGLHSGKVVDVILTPAQLALVNSSPDVEPFDGDPHRFPLAVEGMRLGATVLDRIHQSMMLCAAGRDARFWILAQALSALYSSRTEEKRWVDGVLARKKSLGF